MENRADTTEILEHISQCVITTDLSGVVTYWNPASERVFGYSREEMLNESAIKIYPKVAEEKFLEDLEKLRKGQEIREQWKTITKEGKVIWVDVLAKPITDDKGKPVAIVVSAHEIQELKRIEKELEENIAQAQAILEATIDGIITVNEEGIIKSFNQAASRIFGYSEKEVVGRNAIILLSDSNYFEYDDYLKQYLDSEEKRVVGYRRELTGKRKDGTLFPVELSVSEVQWKGKKLFTGVVNDISERRRLEKEILRISEEERRNLGQDLHDGLGQMLTGISLISQNLARKLKASGIPGASEVQEISNLIKEADEYAKALAHGLIHVNFDEENLQTALYQLSSQAEKFFDVHCSCNCDSSIQIDNQMKAMNLYRIAQEAISNAVKHGKAKKIEINLTADDSSILLSVIDNGIGFTEAALDKKKKGMGIYIMKYRAKMLSGKLEISETDNKRTAVMCSVPHNNI